MRVRVLYFGVLKEIFGGECEMVELAEGSDVAGLLALYRERGRAPANLWESLAVAVNHEYASAGDLLKDGDEVALLPPVSGGWSSFPMESWRSGRNTGVSPVRLRSGQALRPSASARNDASLRARIWMGLYEG